MEDAGVLLTSAAAPRLHVAIVDDAELQSTIETVRHQDEGLAVTRLSGARARTEGAFFAQAARVLGFPNYFGSNWNSFDECITDVRLNRASAYAWFLTEPDLLLGSEDAASLGYLVGTLEDAAETWRDQPTGIGDLECPTPFNVLFACSASTIGPFIRRLKRAGVQVMTSASSKD